MTPPLRLRSKCCVLDASLVILPRDRRQRRKVRDFRTRWSSATTSRTTGAPGPSADSSTAQQTWRRSLRNQVRTCVLFLTHPVFKGYLPPAVRDQVIHKGVAVDFPATTGGVPICKDYLKVNSFERIRKT